MSTRLARPRRHPFHAAWYAVPLLWISCLCGALLIAGTPTDEPVQADVPVDPYAVPAAG